MEREKWHCVCFHGGILLAEPTKVRYAVGVLDTSAQLTAGLEDLRQRGFGPASFTTVALEGVVAPDERGQPTVLLRFAGNTRPIICTSGTLADSLAARREAGASFLSDALGHWLLAQHAAKLEEAVEKGKMLLWIRLLDADDERHAYEGLLSHSSNAVGFHDWNV
jgi:hypothetical protein